MQILAFSDTKMFVSPTQNSGVGGAKPTPGPNATFCVAVEYRLTFSKTGVDRPYIVKTNNYKIEFGPKTEGEGGGEAVGCVDCASV